eukprot:COSAG02_NODE_1358_length_13076_cov_6.377745_4_plen_493_part_00
MALLGVASLLSVSLAPSSATVACSSKDYHCADCLATNDTRPVWAGRCVWLSAAVCDPVGSAGAGHCHRCAPQVWWSQYKQNYQGVFTTNNCSKYPPGLPPPAPPPPSPSPPPPPPCTAALGQRAACWTGQWQGDVSGLPSTQLPDAPTLGNGYTGVLLGKGPFDGLPINPAIDLWINTNANWGCDVNTAKRNITTGPGWNPGKLTPAVCSLVSLGGVSLSVPALGLSSTFEAEQSLSSAAVRTYQNGSAGALETVTYMHPTANVIVTNLTWSGAAPVQLKVALWVRDDGKRQSAARHSADGLLTALRDASTAGGDDSIRRMRTALAVRLPVGAAPANTKLNGTSGSRGAAVASTVTLQPGEVLSLVTSLKDNLLAGNAHDPTDDAVAQAIAKSPGAVAADANAWWAAFWGKAAIALPQSPMIEAFWYGSQYATAAMTASTELLEQTNGLLPPPGLYGPWVSTDSPAWNGGESCGSSFHRSPAVNMLTGWNTL